MAYSFDVVTIGVDDKGPIILRMVMRAKPGRTVIDPARCQRRSMKRIDLRPVFRCKSNVKTAFERLPVLRNPEGRRIGRAEPGMCAMAGDAPLGELHHQAIAQRRKALEKEGARTRIVAHRVTNMIEHKKTPAVSNGGSLRTEADRVCQDQYWRSTIIFLISAIALAGLRPFGQAFEQFMMVWQR